MWKSIARATKSPFFAFKQNGARTIAYKSFQNAGGNNPLTFLHLHRRQLVYLGVGLAGIYAVNLEKVPVSGRWRFMIVPKWLEQRVGASSYRQILAQFDGQILDDRHPEARRIRRIMQKVIQASDLSDDQSIDWRIHVVVGQHPPNAFVLPGGKVFVFQSILPITKDDDGLATVLSHELAHQVCRHTAETMSKSPFLLAIALGINAVIGSSQISSILVDTVLRLPASRSMESEADYVGLMTMAKACFDPRKAVNLWERMRDAEKRGGMNVPQFLSTHPASEQRIVRITEELPEALQIRNQYCGDESMLSSFWSR